MKRLVLFIFFLVCASLFSSSEANAQGKIRTSGMATIYGGAIDIARDKAIENAQRNAVEEQIGVMITSFTEVENFQVKMDQILSESRGFINSYKIITEERVGDLYKVVIEADVGIGRLKDRMAAVDLIMARKSKPRLMIIFSEQTQKEAIAESSMTKYFLSHGFKLVDVGAGKVAKDKALTGDIKDISDIARRYGAEVVILAKIDVTTKSFKMGDVEVTSNEVVVSGKVINGDTGEIIATDSKSRKGTIKSATEESSRELAKDIKEQILDRWASELTNVTTIKLVASGLKSYRELLRFKELVSSNVKGFKQMHQRSFAGDEVDIDVEIKGNAQSLADDVAAQTLEQRKINILDITQNRVIVNVLP